MIRAFAILWVAVFLPTTLLIVPSDFNPIYRLNEYFSKNFYIPIYRANFDILTNKLLLMPQTQWPVIIEQYTDHFAYPIKLEQLSDYKENSEIYPLLTKGEVAFLFGDPMALLKRVEESDYVIYIALNESNEHAVLNQAKGTLYLAIEELQQLPESEWMHHLAKINAKLPIQISLLHSDQIAEYGQLETQLNPQDIVSYVNKSGQVELLAPVKEDLWLHVKDSLSHGVQLQLTTTIVVMFFLIISLALVLWVYPLWRDLSVLVTTATEFGQGKLSKRASTSKLSVVSQLSHSFNSMADNIENLIAGQRELTNAVAHDLRTPLYRLRFALEMLEDPHTSQSQIEKYRNTIHSSIEDLDHLINQNLLLSRYNRIADINHFTQCNFANELSKEIDYFKLEHPKLDIQFHCDEKLTKQMIFIDNKGLMRAVKNLLTNASRFAQHTIIVRFHQQADHFLIVVEDDGKGISDAHRERIFEPFTQLDNQERRSDKGHGLGLAIVKQIMVWHKGNAKVSRSKLGGAAFELTWLEMWPERDKIVTNLDTNRP
ncbi:ATP-binding protein [Vibrio vulnificus]|nr:ATP-binding protein [Vibrio vulnificus]